MKALGTFFENLTSPVLGPEGVRQIVCLVLILFPTLMDLSASQQIQLISAISAILSLFTRGGTVSNKRIDQKVDELVLHREIAGTTGTGTGIAPSTAPPSVVV